MELENQIVEAATEALTKVRGPYDRLHTLTDDVMFSFSLPSEEELAASMKQKVGDRLKELDRILIRERFTFEHATAALNMVNEKLPPNNKNQQFKDSAIWQAVLSLAQRYSVVFITNDKAFYHNGDPQNGLAQNLTQDLVGLNTTAKAFRDISSYLTALESEEPHFDRELVTKLLVDLVRPQLELEAKRLMSFPTHLLEKKVSAFSTANSDQVAIDYSLAFALERVSSLPGSFSGDQRGIVHGSAYYLGCYNPHTGSTT